MTRPTLFSRDFWMAGAAPGAADWVLSAVIGLPAAVLFCQGFDLPVTAQHAMDLIDAISEGQFLRFYGYVFDRAASGAYGAKSLRFVAAYSIVLYATLALWNLPLWLASHVAGIQASPLVLVMWNKALIVGACLLCASVLYRMGVRLNMSPARARWMAFAFMTSPFVTFGALMFGQFDLLSVLFTLLALAAYLQRRLYRFSMLMALAMCFKELPILMFVPLVLLVEKRALHIMKFLAIGCSLVVLQRAVFAFDPGYASTQEVVTRAYHFSARLLANGIETGFGTASFVGLAAIFICVFAYTKQVDDDEELRRYTFYLPLAVWGCTLCFLQWHPQWMVLMAPYVVVCAFTAPSFRLPMFLDTAAGAAYLFVSAMFYRNNADQDMINNGVLPGIFGVVYDNSRTLGDMVAATGVPISAFITVFVACVLANIALEYPGFRPAHEPGDGLATTPGRGVLWPRALVVLVYVAPTMYLYFGRVWGRL